jgi:hypothetical protein
VDSEGIRHASASLSSPQPCDIADVVGWMQTSSNGKYGAVLRDEDVMWRCNSSASSSFLFLFLFLFLYMAERRLKNEWASSTSVDSFTARKNGKLKMSYLLLRCISGESGFRPIT